MDHKESLRRGDMTVLKSIYTEHKAGFIMFAKQYNLDIEDILDVYQDANVALFENAKKGHLDNLDCSLKTYLYSIGKFMIFKRLKKMNRQTGINENQVDKMVIWDDYDGFEENEQIGKLRTAINSMSGVCKEILTLFYYEEKKLEEIMTLLDYSNKDVLKSQKSRCLKQLKQNMKP